MQTISPKKYVPDTTGINSTLAAHIIGFARSGVNKEMAHLIEDSAKAGALLSYEANGRPKLFVGLDMVALAWSNRRPVISDGSPFIELMRRGSLLVVPDGKDHKVLHLYLGIETINMAALERYGDD